MFNWSVRLWVYDWQAWMLTMRMVSPLHFLMAASHSVMITGADALSCWTHTWIQVSGDEQSSLVLQRQLFVCSTKKKKTIVTAKHCRIIYLFPTTSQQAPWCQSNTKKQGKNANRFDVSYLDVRMSCNQFFYMFLTSILDVNLMTC